MTAGLEGMGEEGLIGHAYTVFSDMPDINHYEIEILSRLKLFAAIKAGVSKFVNKDVENVEDDWNFNDRADISKRLISAKSLAVAVYAQSADLAALREKVRGMVSTLKDVRMTLRMQYHEHHLERLRLNYEAVEYLIATLTTEGEK